jgi:hypothetical protein
MTSLAMLVLLLLLSSLSCGAGELNITTFQKSIEVMDGGGTVIAEGRWRRTSARPSINAPTINTVRVECDRVRRVCEELMAKMLQPSDDPLGTLRDRYLFVDQTPFRVVEWSNTLLVARAEQPVADLELRIALADKSAERTRRETGARGAQGADLSHVDQWVLE